MRSAPERQLWDQMNRLSGARSCADSKSARDLERLLGRKTLEIEILREALAKSESKKPSLRLLSQPKDGSR